MILLPLSCSCSELKVNPKNWQTAKPSFKKDWFIYYCFYDPINQSEQAPRKGKLIIKGMNQFKTVTERQAKTLELVQWELKRLKEVGYNPTTGKSLPVQTVNEISPEIPFIAALEVALPYHYS